MIELTWKKIHQKIIKNYKKNKNFVLFKKPNENKIFFYDQNKKIKNNKKYFLISSFNCKNTIKIYSKKIYFLNLKKFIQSSPNYLNKEKKKNYLKYSIEYKNLIKKAISTIKKKNLQKVVVSRFIKIPFHKFYLKKTFQKLIYSYPKSFITYWYNIHYGSWIGATPELFLKLNDQKLQTIPLAGTIFNNKKWTKKELEEHKIVIKYIVNILKSYSGNITIGKIKSIKVGNLSHLKTSINFNFLKKEKQFSILNRLHPTPSICGYPKKKSWNFIKKNEKFKRNFYTGYFGTVDDKKKNMELYLNLRCARIRINKKDITLYAGSGITKYSNLNQEYIETENKIKSIISQLIFK
ncbi:chorismate-binding protein [Blattabacterium cuenoti]|uniref:chorismate-binding protein n=1 Tax=Blattabacterium cuenoti TaxID=1653831 RepID=UPI00163D00DA|nr:chorismate-binding protein [Blattabacterium cuenoti]